MTITVYVADLNATSAEDAHSEKYLDSGADALAYAYALRGRETVFFPESVYPWEDALRDPNQDVPLCDSRTMPAEPPSYVDPQRIAFYRAQDDKANAEAAADDLLGRVAEVMQADSPRNNPAVETLQALRALLREPSQPVPTIETTIPPIKGLTVLQRLDHAYEYVQLVPELVKEGDPLKFGVWIDGESTAHSVHLKADGTWVFRTHIQV